MRFLVLCCLLPVLLCSYGQALEGELVAQEPAIQEPVQELLYDGKGLPRLHHYDGEDTAFLSVASSRLVVTRGAGTFSRTLYDQEYRLQSRLTWQEAASEASAEGMESPARLTLQEDYFYYENSRSRQKVVLTDFSQSRRTERFYSQDGLLTREVVYEPDEKKASEQREKTGSKDLNLQVVNSQDAADLLHLSVNQVVEYFYNSAKDLIEKRITHYGREKTLVEKTLYHSPGNIHGGYDYFENEVLLVSRKYEDESVCTETRYFDTMKIESKYNGARLLSEVVYLDSKEIRRTEY